MNTLQVVITCAMSFYVSVFLLQATLQIYKKSINTNPETNKNAAAVGAFLAGLLSLLLVLVFLPCALADYVVEKYVTIHKKTV